MSSPAAAASASWGVVVPVKRLTTAKSRLAPYDEQARAELALAMAQDVVSEALRTPAVGRVVVVTSDGRAAAALAGLGAEIVPDEPDEGLNPALERGAAALAAGQPVAAVAADLPCLRSTDLAQVLAAVPAGARHVLADRSGTGTTVLLAGAGAALAPEYGLGSLARHVAAGAHRVNGPSGLHLDVDTQADLQLAAECGLGRHTAEAWTRLAAPLGLA